MSLTKLVKQSANISLDRLANCLSNLAEVDPNCAKSILKAHGPEKISIGLNKLNPSLRKDALWKLIKVDQKFMEEVC
jgi:hypothetical protein